MVQTQAQLGGVRSRKWRRFLQQLQVQERDKGLDCRLWGFVLCRVVMEWLCLRAGEVQLGILNELSNENDDDR